MSKGYEPPSVRIFPWLRANLPGCLAALTGTDTRALRAAVELMELYSYHREPKLVEAFGEVVRVMQPSTRQLAYHAIAMVMDWPDRRRIWQEAGLGTIENLRICVHES